MIICLGNRGNPHVAVILRNGDWSHRVPASRLGGWVSCKGRQIENGAFLIGEPKIGALEQSGYSLESRIVNALHCPIRPDHVSAGDEDEITRLCADRRWPGYRHPS